jgi:hypothetical protein
MWQKMDQTNDADTNWNKFWAAPLLYWMVLLGILTNVLSNTYDHEQCWIRFNCLFLNCAYETGLSLFLRDRGPLIRNTAVLTVTSTRIFPVTCRSVRRTVVSIEECSINSYTSGNKQILRCVTEACLIPPAKKFGLLLYR